MLNEEKQKKVILIGWILLIPLAFTIALTLIQRVSAKKGSFTDDTVSGEYFTVDTNGTAKTDEISLYTGGGMPCENPEAFERWYETYEQETMEEDEFPAKEYEGSDREETEMETYEEVLPGHEDEAEVETDDEDETDSPSEEILQQALFSVDGRVLRQELQTYLYDRLSEQGIEWFMPYSIMIAYQESHFDIYAENRNGLDKGLFQYRITYYPGENIFDPYEQIDIFVQQMAYRADIGCDVYEMISRHNVSDYGTYNEVYVSQVMQHEPFLREVKQ